jgi:hypothetical protein
MKRIADPVLRLRRLAADQQQGLPVAVVDEAVADPGARRKGRQVASLHRVQLPVDPGLDSTLEHVDELLLALFGVRPR